jgi:hypothetical protein
MVGQLLPNKDMIHRLVDHPEPYFARILPADTEDCQMDLAQHKNWNGSRSSKRQSVDPKSYPPVNLAMENCQVLDDLPIENVDVP